MNKKVLTTMVSLMGVFIMTCYVLKFFFPEQFVMSIENPALISIGQYIDSHQWLFYLFGIFTSFITYWFYLCAVCHRWYLKWYECLMVLGIIGATIGLSFVDANLSTALSYASFAFLPAIFGSDLKSVAICYSIHIPNQFITLSIRNLMAYVATRTTLNIMLLSIDMYLWLMLLYFCGNYKKINRRRNMGWQLPPVYGKKGPKYYDNKISKIDAKIAKLQEERAVYVAKRAEFDKPKTEVVEG